jgi:hypothetical protein
MSYRTGGLVLILIGAGVALIGVLLWSGALSWFGRLPGDIRIERESFRVYLPLTSMLIASAVLSLFLYIIKKFLS